MATQGKKYRAAAAKVDTTRMHSTSEAVDLVKQTTYAKFDATVDVAVRLGVDPRHADQVVRGTVILPHGTGKTVRVLVVAQGDRAKDAEAAGADFVGLEYLAKLKEGWLECDVIVATPDVMGQLGALRRGVAREVDVDVRGEIARGLGDDGIPGTAKFEVSAR